MRPLTVATLGDLAYAKALGKKSTESDVLLASFREGGCLVSLVVPHRHPEKPAALSYAVQSADAGLLVASTLDRALGESVLAADASGLEQGLVVLRGGDEAQLAPLLRGTCLERWTMLPGDKPGVVRAALAQFASRAREGPVRVPIDHHFDVKGIGAVALGFVRRGAPRRHETYRVYPTKLAAQVRSVHVHDEDVEQAQPGDHVGLALKGVASAQLDRGFVLAPDGSMHARAEGDAVRLRVACSKFFKQGVREGTFTLGLGWQFVTVRVQGEVAPGATGSVEAVLQGALAHDPGERGVLFQLDAPQRVVGGAEVAG